MSSNTWAWPHTADHEPPARCPTCGHVQSGGEERHFRDCPLALDLADRLDALEARMKALEVRAADAEAAIEHARSKLPPFLRVLLPPRPPKTCTCNRDADGPLGHCDAHSP